MAKAGSSDPGVAPPTFALRPGRAEDFDFARTLYMSSMKPLLSALDAWKQDEIESAFRSYYIANEVRIITLDGEDIGWIQVSHTDTEFCLDQLHLVEAARGKGIGTHLINETIAEAGKENKNVSLSLVKGNRARNFYQRLGFHQVAEDSTKIHKRYINSSAT